ncbi:hypothetical protein MAR_018731, partial [Mya arenaria]
DLSPLIPDIVDLCDCIRDLEKDQLNIYYKQELENIIQGRLTDVETQVSMLSNICYMVMFVVCFMVMFVVCFLTVLHFWSRNTLSPRTSTMPRMRTSEIGECVTEDIYGDFPNPLSLEPYLKRHKKLVGREWLFDIITKSIQTMNPSTRGLVMKADMGYGKSAFVAH